MLTNWGAPAHVCLAGLMHSVLGRDLSALPVTGISHEEVLSTVGSEAFAVISAFKASATLEKHGTLLSGSAGDALLVEVANTLEQAQDDEEFCQVNRLADDLPECYGGIRQRIQADVIQFRNQLRNRAFAEGAGSSCHHGS
jgi:hypothetical protein